MRTIKDTVILCWCGFSLVLTVSIKAVFGFVLSFMLSFRNNISYQKINLFAIIYCHRVSGGLLWEIVLIKPDVNPLVQVGPNVLESHDSPGKWTNTAFISLLLLF